MTTRSRPLAAALVAASAAAGLAACGAPSLKSTQPSLTPPTLECSAAGQAASAASALDTVCLLTSQGELVLELDAGAAPITVGNFLRYVTEGFYDLTIIHRVLPGSIIQGGGVNSSFNAKPTHPPIAFECAASLRHERGAIAMARLADPSYDSAASQFFVDVVAHPQYDCTPGTDPAGAYAAFGRVISGLDVVDRIAALPTYATVDGTFNNLPDPMVIVYWARQLK